jgi:hypothetical protein
LRSAIAAVSCPVAPQGAPTPPARPWSASCWPAWPARSSRRPAGLDAWRTTALLDAATGALAGLARVEPRRQDPLIEFGLFRSARFGASVASGVCGIADLAGFGFITSLYLQDVRDMTALHAELTIGPMPAEMAVCAPLAGRLIARRGTRTPAVAAGIALAASSAALSRLSADSSTAFLAVTYSLLGVGAGLLSPAVTYGVMSSVPDGRAGVASGINSTSRQLGQCLGVALADSVLDGSLHQPMQTGFTAAARGSWLIMAGCGLLVLIAGLTGSRARPRGATPGQVGSPAALLTSLAWETGPADAVPGLLQASRTPAPSSTARPRGRSRPPTAALSACILISGSAASRAIWDHRNGLPRSLRDCCAI